MFITYPEITVIKAATFPIINMILKVVNHRVAPSDVKEVLKHTERSSNATHQSIPIYRQNSGDIFYDDTKHRCWILRREDWIKE